MYLVALAVAVVSVLLLMGYLERSGAIRQRLRN